MGMFSQKPLQPGETWEERNAQRQESHRIAFGLR